MRLLAFLCLFLIVFGFSPPAEAGGLTVDPGRITANEPIAPGSRVDLPTYTVTNDVGVDARIKVTVSDYRDKERTLPPAEWFKIEPSELSILAGGSGKVKVTLALPKDAPAGQYKVWFRFSSEPLTVPGGIVNVVNLQVPFIFDVGAKGAGSGTVSVPPKTTEREKASEPKKDASSETTSKVQTLPAPQESPTQDTASRPAGDLGSGAPLAPVQSTGGASPAPWQPNRLAWAGLGAGGALAIGASLILRRLMKRR